MTPGSTMPDLPAPDSGMVSAFLAASPDCIKLLDRDGVLLFMNQRGIEQNQICALDEVIGRPMTDLWPAAERRRVQAAIARAAAGEPTRIEGYCPTARGEPRWWEVSFAACRADDPADVRIVGVSRDISFQRAMQIAVRSAGATSDLPGLSDRLGTWTLDPATGMFAMSPMGQAIFGRDPGMPLTHADLDAATHPDDRARRAAALDRLIRSGEDLDIEFRIYTPSGNLRWIQVRGEAVRDDDGRITRLQGVSLDVTARAVADLRRDALIELNDSFGRIEHADELAYAAAEILGRTFGVSRAGYGTIDTVEETIEIVRDWNAPGMASIAGTLHFREYGSYIEDLKRGDTVVVADAHRDPRTRDNADTLIAINARSFVNMPVTEMGRFVALLFVNNDGVREWSADELAFMREMAQRTRIAVERRRAQVALRDLNASLEARVSERTHELAQAHEALRQSQKLEAIGQLTGGVAHDFNNLLTVIGGSAGLLRRPNLADAKRARYIDAIIDTVGRASKLTSQLLAFARRQALRPETFDVGRNVAAVGDIVRSLTGSRITVETDVGDRACHVSADPSQFDTALINMAVNARDAMNGEGRMAIAVRVADGMPAIRAHPAKAGDYVAVSVSDTGVGIAPDQLERVFEPFFTTKVVGQGTGLGLSQVFGFAKQSGGEVHVESEPGVRTTFTLFLPAVATPSVLPDGADATEPPVEGHGTRVLIVEDNPSVLEFAARTLAELGHTTVAATDGQAALAELAQDASRFDVIFSDVMMPGMTGIELGQQVQRLHPGLPVILTSGYSDVLAEKGTCGFELLDKPYSMEQLSGAIRKLARRATTSA